jgi:hypothetical protein
MLFLSILLNKFLALWCLLSVNYCCYLSRLERKTLKRKKVLATLKVLWSVIEDLTREISPEDADKLISEEVCVTLVNLVVHC